MVTIFNFTPSVVRLMDDDDNIIVIFEPSGTIAYTVKTAREVWKIDIGSGIFVGVIKTFVARPIGITSFTEGVFLIVSRSVALAAKNAGRRTSDLLTPYDLVQGENEQDICCRRFAAL